MSDTNELARLQPGIMLGQYLLEAPLGIPGSSANAEVGALPCWQANDTKMDRTVILRPATIEQASNPEFLAAFRKECRALARVTPKCPHTVTVLDFVEDAGTIFSVTDHCPGRTLEDLVAARELTDKQRFQVLVQMLMGLSEVHSANLVHGDLRLSAVLVDTAPAASPDTELFARLTDFRIGGLPDESLPMSAMKYTAPERLRGGAANPAADLYAAGMVAYEMFAGDKFADAFADIVGGDTDSQPLRWMQWQASPAIAKPLGQLNPKAAELAWIGPVVAKLLSKDPATRYATAGTALTELRTAAQRASGKPVTTRPTSGTATPGSTVTKPASVAVSPTSGPAKPVSAGTVKPASTVTKPASTVAEPVAVAVPVAQPVSTLTAVTVPLAVAVGTVPPLPVTVGTVPPPPVAVMPQAVAVPAAVNPAYNSEDTEERIKALQAAAQASKPIYLRPAYLALFLGLILFGVILAGAYLSGRREKELKQAAIKAYNEQNWIEARDRHRELAEEQKSRRGDDDIDAARSLAIADLCEAKSLETKDPLKSAEIANKLKIRFNELEMGSSKFFAIAENLARKALPESEFNQAFERFVIDARAYNLTGMAAHLAKMVELNRDRGLGKQDAISLGTALRQGFDEADRRQRELRSYVDRLDAGEQTKELGEDLKTLASALEAIANRLDALRLPTELDSLTPTVRSLAAQARAGKDHANNILRFFTLCQYGERQITEAKTRLQIADKNKPALPQFEEAFKNFDAAVKLAELLAKNQQGGIPKSRLDDARNQRALSEDAKNFLAGEFQALIERTGTAPNFKIKYNVGGRSRSELEGWRDKLAAMRDRNTLEQLRDASGLYSAINAEIEALDKASINQQQQQKYDELDMQAREAGRQGDFAKEIAIREEMAKIRSLPKEMDIRVTELRKALQVLPVLETQAMAMSTALKAAGERLKEPAKLIKAAPGQPADLMVDEVVRALDEARVAGAVVVGEAGGLSVFKTEQPLKDILLTSRRDLDAIDKLVGGLSALRGDVVRFEGFMADAERAKPQAKHSYWLDAETLIRKMEERPADPLVAPVQRELTKQLSKVVKYNRATVEIDKKLNNIDSYLKAASTAPNVNDRMTWLKYADTAVKEIEATLSQLPFPLEGSRAERYEKARKELKER